jgi:hypothetical protein
MESIVAAELGEAMEKNVAAYREVLASTPVDHVKVKERPVVVFLTPTRGSRLSYDISATPKTPAV